MAADYIVVNRAKQLGNKLVRTADLLAEVRSNVRELVAAANHANDGSDFSQMETIFGLPAATGPNVVTLVNIMNDTLNTNVDKTGDVRLGQIDEFVARVAGQ